jgi:hypothetical protein
MAVESESGSLEALARLERDMANVKDALGLLGAKPCSNCGKFYLRSNPGDLFKACGDSVCYACFPSWWSNVCPKLSASDREAVEYKLTRWLIDHHHAAVFRDFSELPPRELQDLHMVVGCRECKGSGKQYGTERCRSCLGNGTVWVVTLKQR